MAKTPYGPPQRKKRRTPTPGGMPPWLLAVIVFGAIAIATISFILIAVTGKGIFAGR